MTPDRLYEVAEAGEAGGQRRIGRQVADQPVMKRDAVLCGARRCHLDLHPRHVDADRAFPLAGLAGDTQLHGLGHRIACHGVGAKLARHRKAQRIRPSAHRVALVAGGPVGRAHHPAGQLAAGAVVVAHLDSALEPASGAGPCRPVENAVEILRLITRGEAEQLTLIHLRRISDLAGVKHTLRVEHRLHLAEQVRQHRPEHPVVEFRADDAVAMLARMRSAKGPHQLERLFGDGAHGLGPACLLHVQNRTDMKAADRGMGVPGALHPVAIEDGGQLVGIFGEVLQLDRAILEEGDGLCLALLAHHDVEAGLAPLGDAALHAGVDGIDDTAAPRRALVPAEAEVPHHLVKLAQPALVLRHILFGELDEKKRRRIAAHRLFDRRLEDRDGAGELDHRVIDQFHRHRIERDEMLRRVHRLVESREMADSHDLLRRQRPKLELNRGAVGERSLGPDKKMRQVDAVASRPAGAHRHGIRNQRIHIVAANAAKHFRKAVQNVGAMGLAHRQQARLQLLQQAGW